MRPTEFGFVVKKIYDIDPEEGDPVLRAWGRYREYDMFTSTDHRLQSWLQSKVRMVTGIKTSEQFQKTMRLRALGALRSEKFHPKITLWLSQEHRDNDRKTAMKPTRALSTLFPELDHKQLMQITDLYLQEFAPRDFTVHVSEEADDFRRAYAGDQSPTENILTTRTHKHSAHSCMRYEFENLPCHPATAYASGDFSIIFVTDQNNDIAGRCVVCTSSDFDKPQAGPIYGVSEQAIDCIEERLESMDARYGDDDTCEGPSWVGARLKRIEHNGAFVAPYLDLLPQRVTDTGNSLVIDHHGEIDASVYTGLLGAPHAECSECGSGIDEDDTYHSETTHNCYCESCYYEDHFWCEYAQEDTHKDGALECYRTTYNGTKEKVLVCEHHVWDGDDFVFCSDGCWWHVDDVAYCEFDDEWISPDSIADYFCSDWDGDQYPKEMMRTTVDGEVVSNHEMKEHPGIWQKNADDRWEQVQEEMEV